MVFFPLMSHISYYIQILLAISKYYKDIMYLRLFHWEINIGSYNMDEEKWGKAEKKDIFITKHKQNIINEAIQPSSLKHLDKNILPTSDMNTHILGS